MHRILFAALIALCTCVSLQSQKVPTPDDFLPHRLGENFTPHHLMVDYYEAVAAASPRVQLIEYGRTNEARPLLLAFISTPENLARLEDIRLNNLRRAGLAPGAPKAELDLSIVWLSYTVHGNEAAGAEAGMGVLYDLANTDNSATSGWLQNTVVIIDPAVNPDGYSRYTNWYRQVAGLQVDPAPGVREHDEPWPGGRVNHYLFDLNRDWAWQTQVESQQRMVEYHRWMPHVHADVHEQGYTEPYYFAPAAAPFHEYITDWQGVFQTEIGRNHARYFDREGWLYFTRERFDLLYPSYGDTYPTFNGSIGMTYEQGGHSRAGRAIDLPTGDTLTLADRVAHHRTTSLSTIEISSRENERLVREFGKYFQESQSNPPGKYKTYVVSGATPRGRMRAFLQLLDRNGIEYSRAVKAQSLTAYDYKTGNSGSANIQVGDLLVSAFQPRAILTQVLFDPEATLEDSVTYDITAWSIPHAFGLQAYASTERIRGASETYELPAFNNPLNGVSQANVYAYILPWEDLSSARFLAAAMQMGIQTRMASDPGKIGNKSFPAGSVIINRGDNRKTADFDQKIARLVAEHEANIIPVQTGFSDAGFDLGSPNYELSGLPRIATVAGDETSTNGFGQVWHFFEQDLQYPLHIYHYDDLGDIADDDIDVLILPPGFYSFSEGQASALTGWIRSGGKLIALGGANQSLARTEGFGLSPKSSGGDDGEASIEDQLLPYDGAERRFISNYVPGAVVQTEFDTTHPLSFGLGESYASLKTGSAAFDYLENGQNVGRVRSEPWIAGFMGANAKERLKESLSFGVQSMGGGEVIYLVDNPLFRGFWQNGKLLFSNALFQVN